MRTTEMNAVDPVSAFRHERHSDREERNGSADRKNGFTVARRIRLRMQDAARRQRLIDVRHDRHHLMVHGNGLRTRDHRTDGQNNRRQGERKNRQSTNHIHIRTLLRTCSWFKPYAYKWRDTLSSEI